MAVDSVRSVDLTSKRIRNIMPLYDTRCMTCGELQYNVYHKSSEPPPLCKCGSATEHVWSKGPPVHVFQEGFYEHAADEDGKVPYFSSRNKYKAWLKEHGMYADYVEGR